MKIQFFCDKCGHLFAPREVIFSRLISAALPGKKIVSKRLVKENGILGREFCQKCFDKYFADDSMKVFKVVGKEKVIKKGKNVGGI